MNNMGNAPNAFLQSIVFPFILAVSVIVGTALFIPFEIPMPDYLLDMATLTGGKSLEYGFSPVGYPVLLFPGYRLADSSGIFAFQGILYASAIVLVHQLFRRKYNCSALLLTIVVFSVALHPYVVLNMKRVTDNGVNLFFVSVCIWWLIGDKGILSSIYKAVIYGLVLGLWSSVRPNAILFPLLVSVPPIYFPQLRSSRYLRCCIVFGLSILIAITTVNYIGTKHAIYWPRNGPYNLFAGNNPYSFEALKNNANAEQSISAGLIYYNRLPADGNLKDVDGRIYTELSVKYLMENPIGFVKNSVMKLIVLFSPDWRQANTILKKAVQLVLVAPSIFYAFTLFRYSRARRASEIILGLLFVAFFVVPFLITNSDPRFRLPILDIYFVVHGVVIIIEKSNGSYIQNQGNVRWQTNSDQEKS